MNESGEKTLTDYFDINFLQDFQNAFSDATGMASICVDLEGPVTQPSNFTDFCNILTRGTPTGLKRCVDCDIKGGAEAERTHRPSVYYCHAGLMDFGAPIIVDGKQVGSILGGQVLPEKPDEEKFRRIAGEIGVDPDLYIEALRKVKIVPERQIRQAANLMYISISEVAKVRTQFLKLEKSHEVIEDHVNYVDDQVAEFTGAFNQLSDEQHGLLNELTSLKVMLDNLNKIVNAVTKIAQNSNLLSFNASVEAARSGLEGRGFGVIAKEMRNLSNETTEILSQIENYTSEVLAATNQLMEINSTSMDSLASQLVRLKSVSPRLQSIVAEIDSLK